MMNLLEELDSIEWRSALLQLVKPLSFKFLHDTFLKVFKSFPHFRPWDRGIHKIGLASLASRCATVGFPNKSFASYVQHKSRKALGLFCISSYLEQCSSDQNTLVSCLTERIDERHMSLQLGQKDKSTGLTQ